MEKIGVFCSASDDLPEHFTQAALELGTWMGHNHKTLVYGGSYKGLMGTVGHACRENGGRLMGMVPRILLAHGWEEPNLDVTFPCENLTDRKDLMNLHSEVLVALPGGVGTLDEVFTVMGAHSMGTDEKRVIFLNIDGFWQPIIDFLKSLEQKGMMRKGCASYFSVANNVDELIELLK